MNQKSSRRKKSRNKRRNPDEIISDEWIEKIKTSLTELEKNTLDSPQKVYSNAMRMLLTYRCMAEFTMHYAPKELLGKILRDTERVAVRVGTSLNPHMEEVSKCLTERHE